MTKKIIYVILATMLSMLILLTAVQMVSFNINHYMNSFIKHDIPSVTGIDMENLEEIVKDILLYFKDDREILDTVSIVKGEEREIFGERERLHMIDVKNLFVWGRRIRNSLIFLVPLLAYLLTRKDKKWRRTFSRGLINMAIVNWVFLILFLLMVTTDFTRYFTYFHYIFFTNDLWLLDPNHEILIQMLPEEFFYSSAVKIMLLYISTISALGIGGYVYNRKLKMT